MEDYLNVSLLGAFRAAITMPLEHPLDYIKTNIQSKMHLGKTIPFIQQHLNQHGFKSLYSGLIPNTIRASIKQFYRLPLMVAFPGFYRKIFASEARVQIMTGISIAALESYIICPLERLKVWLMTSNKLTLYSFFKEMKSYNELFKGINALFYRQLLSWVSFLGLTFVFKDLTRTIKGDLNYKDLFLIGILVGVFNTLIIMPVDFAKTHLQKFGEVEGKGIIELFKQLTVQENSLNYKLRVVYCGWRVRIFHYMLNSVFTVSLYEYVDQKVNKKRF